MCIPMLSLYSMYVMHLWMEWKDMHVCYVYVHLCAPCMYIGNPTHNLHLLRNLFSSDNMHVVFMRHHSIVGCHICVVKTH